MINQVKKNWGNEEWLVNNNLYCSKFLNLIKGYQCSVHYHIIKDETFYVLDGIVSLSVVDLRKYVGIVTPILSDGEAEFIVENVKQKKTEIIKGLSTVVLHKGDQLRLKPFMAHKFTSLTDTAKILEVSTTHYEPDSYRLTESGPINQ